MLPHLLVKYWPRQLKNHCIAVTIDRVAPVKGEFIKIFLKSCGFISYVQSV